MNTWSFIGRVGRDGEFRVTSTGKEVLSFSVAVDSGFGQNKKTTWTRVFVWGKRGEALAKYIIKGNQIGVVGEVSLNEYTAKDGTTKYTLDVNASDVTLIKSGSPQAEQATQIAGEFEDSEIPF